MRFDRLLARRPRNVPECPHIRGLLSDGLEEAHTGQEAFLTLVDELEALIEGFGALVLPKNTARV